MTPAYINSLDPIIKVLYHEKGKLRSFLTKVKGHKRTIFTVYSHDNKWGKTFTQEELDEISELMGSPIEKIDFEELEKF